MQHTSPPGSPRLATACLAVCLLTPAFGAVPLVGNLTVTQNDTGNTEASVSGALSQSNGATYVGGTRGDFGLRFDGATPAADVTNGVLMVSLRENGRSNQGTTPNPIGAGLGFASPAIQSPGNLGAPNPSYAGYSSSINISNTAITTTNATTFFTSGDEWNTSQSFAYFKYSDWLGGWVKNSANNGAMDGFTSSSAGFTAASGTTDPGTATVFDSTANDGFYTLRLGGFNASRGTNSAVPATSQNGILLVTGGKNEDNYALSSANADGTFTLISKDNGSDGFNFENDPVAFVYIPAGHNDVAAMGRIDAEGDATANSGSFTVTKGGTGQWYLTAPGRNDSNSVLLISPEGATVSGTNRADNIWSFAWDAANNRWVIESRDVSATASATPTLQNMTANEPAFSFALFDVGAGNPLPVVSLDSPSDGSSIATGTPITLTATASDDSAVAKVGFYDGTTLLGEDTTAPYEFVWNSAALGNHVLTAKATDDHGASANSASATISVTPPPGTGGLYFDGADDHVTFGDNPALKLATFTLECWFKREAGGVPAGTGSGGVSAIPLISKGRGEADTPANINCNYFMGIDVTTGKLAADFEDTNTGLNHPAVGQTVIPVGVWQHAAVTFDGTSWTLYLNGKEEATVSTEGQVPQNFSIQHAGLGTAMNSTGVREGYFHGQMDEVRIWNTARDLGEIQSTLNSQVTSASGLVARYAMDEASGTSLLSSAGATVTGTLVNGAFRTTGAPFDLNVPPTISLVSPADNALNVPLASQLSAEVNDLNGGNLQVKFYGRNIGNASHSNDFTVVALPDTQFYSENNGGNLAQIFSAQTEWIVAERDTRSIGFVLHLGDITDNGDTPVAGEWANACNALYALENPTTTMRPEGMPYIVAVGNHDQTPNGDADGTTTNFNTYFGVHPTTGINHFGSKSYYGGTSEPTKADNNFTLFSAGGMDFIVISLEYDTTPDVADLNWADALLKAYPTRRGIVITHHMVNTGFPASFSTLGSAIYESLKDNPNLFLMHGGHVHGEGRRSDTFQGRTVHSILADYQGRTNGGDGWLRIMTFRPSLNRIDVQTYSPTLNQFETDSDSQFSLDVNLSGGVGPFTELGSETVSPGPASFAWSGLEAGGRYEWYAEVSDGTSTITTPVRSFTTEGAVFPPTVALTGPTNGAHFAAPANITLEATAADTDGTVTKVEFYSGTTLLGEDTTAPYSFDWQNVPAGSYTIIAKATDEEGVTTSADPVSVQVLVDPSAPDVKTVSAGLFEGNWTVAATSAAPRSFENPGSNTGDIELVLNGSPVPFLSGVTAVTNWNNGGQSADNIASTFSSSGNAVVSVADNSNPNAADSNPTTTEESAGTAVAFLPFSGGFTGALVSPDGSVLASNLPAGVEVNKTGSGLYTVTGLSIGGNLLAFPNGNAGTTDGDNVVSVRISNGTWIIDTRDNAGTSQDISFSFVYLPYATPGVMSGMIRTNGSPAILNGELNEAGGNVTVNANYYDLTIGNGTVINPSNSALFLTADSTASGQAADNIVSYTANGNSFRVFTQDLPELNGAFQAIDVRFVVVPFSLSQQPVITLPVVSIEATDATGGEYGADQSLGFTVTRTGPTTEALSVSFTTSGTASGSDVAALSGSVEIPVGQSSAVIPVAILADEEAEGDESLTVTLSSNASYELGTPNASATIADRPLQAFLKANQLGAPNADDDGDGVANVLEYYLGTDGDDDASRATVTAITAAGGSFTARFPHAKGVNDVNTAIEWSTDLTSWHRSGESNGSQTANIAIQPVSPAEEDPETLEAVLTVTAGPAPASVYLRLSVAP